MPETNPDKQIEWATYAVGLAGVAIAIVPPIMSQKLTTSTVLPGLLVVVVVVFVKWAMYTPHTFERAVLRQFEADVLAEEKGVLGGSKEGGPETLLPTQRQEQMISGQEMKILRYFERIILSDKDPLVETFTMVGGRPDCMAKQIGFTSIRYHLAFAGYAIAALCATRGTPAYLGVSKRLLGRIVELILDHRCWSYVNFWWAGEEAEPFKCSENIMYTGHVLMLVTLYEAVTGDDRYARKGGIVAVGEDGAVHTTSTQELASHLAKLCQKSSTGGIACEPSCVFPPCQGHHLFAFRLLEAMAASNHEGSLRQLRATMGFGGGNAPQKQFTEERVRWERYLLKNMKASIPSGALKIFMSERLKGAVPLGHPGNDGWVFTYMYAYTSSTKALKMLWETVGKSRVKLGRWMQALKKAKRKSDFPPPDSCCNALNIPEPTWTAFLFPFLVQIGEDAMATEIQTFLEDNYLVDAGDEASIQCGIEWSIASTANYLIGLCLTSNAEGLRDLANRPNPKSFFVSEPIIASCDTDDVEVYRATKESRMDKDGATVYTFHLSFQRRAEAGEGVADVGFAFSNVGAGTMARFLHPEAAEGCTFQDGTLLVAAVPGGKRLNVCVELSKTV
jgi:hypothetical protein